MVRIGGGKSSAAAARKKDDEFVSLTGGRKGKGPRYSSADIARYKKIGWVIVIGCVLLFLWDHTGGSGNSSASTNKKKSDEAAAANFKGDDSLDANNKTIKPFLAEDTFGGDEEGTLAPTDDFFEDGEGEGGNDKTENPEVTEEPQVAEEPQVVEDHDHDGDGIQDHAPEDHVDQEGEIKDKDEISEPQSESDVAEKTADDGQEKENQTEPPDEHGGWLDDDLPEEIVEEAVEEMKETDPPEVPLLPGSTTAPELGTASPALPANEQSMVPDNNVSDTIIPGMTASPILPQNTVMPALGGGTGLPQATQVPELPEATIGSSLAATTTPALPVPTMGPADTIIPKATIPPVLPGGASQTGLPNAGAATTMPETTTQPVLPATSIPPQSETTGPAMPATNTMVPGIIVTNRPLNPEDASMLPQFPGAATTPPTDPTATATTTPALPGAATITPSIPGAATTTMPGAATTTTVPGATIVPGGDTTTTMPALPVTTTAPILPGDTTMTVTDPNLPSDGELLQQASPECQQQCSVPPAMDATTMFDGQDMTLAANMQERIQQFRQQWIDQQLIQEEYGEYYQGIFEPTKDPVTGESLHMGNQQAFKDPMALPLPKEKPSQSTGIGWTRMVQKWQIKMLQVQNGILEQQLNATGHCLNKCALEDFQMAPETFSKFIWVNGGHSASAGHGNFYRESYTAVLGRDLKPILKEIGLDFVAKNYAMGGTESAEEVALCMNSIFGKDFDQITWDYGMTDGREHYKMAMYAYRAARLSQQGDVLSQPGNIRHRPSMWTLHQNDDFNFVLRGLQSVGMSVLGMDLNYKSDVLYPAFPDVFGMTDSQIESLPSMVRYFKCEDKIEVGDPGCWDHKYNMTMCTHRKKKTSWHPGVKYHALIGHMMAFTTLELIDQALQELMKVEAAVIQPETPQARQTRLLVQLRALDKAEQFDYDRIFNSPVPSDLITEFHDLWRRNPDHKDAMNPLPIRSLIKAPALCHTATLPAEIRYRGILTENFEEVGGPEEDTYEHAVFQIKDVKVVEKPMGPKPPGVYVDQREGRKNLMVLAAKDDERDDCDAQTHLDYKDYFLVTSSQSWRWIKLPNNAEMEYYKEFDKQRALGYIFICPAVCDWGKCPKGDLQKQVMDLSEDPEFGSITMEVNLRRVTSVNCMNHCCALKHDDPDPAKQFVWQATPKGTYEFRAMISGASSWSYARFSSVILL